MTLVCPQNLNFMYIFLLDIDTNIVALLSETEIFNFDVQGPVVQLEVEGSGFLYRQVRNMV